MFGRGGGGEGVGPAIGVADGMMPRASVAGTVPGLVVLYYARKAGVAAGVGFIALLGAALFLERPLLLTLAVAGLPVLALIRELWLPGPGRRRRIRGQTNA